MKSLRNLIIEGKRASDFVPAGYRVVQTWGAQEWLAWWQAALAERAPGWKQSPRASHEHLEALQTCDVPPYVKDGLLYIESKPLIARVREDAERQYYWKLLSEHEAAHV